MTGRDGVAVYPFPEPLWGAYVSDEVGCRIVWQINEAVGLVVLNADRCRDPEIVFCSLFDNPDRVLYSGDAVQGVGIPISQLEAAVERIKGMIRDQRTST